MNQSISDKKKKKKVEDKIDSNLEPTRSDLKL